jgi:hypothetical protein
MRYTVKVATGPGTAGYEHHTAKQNAKKSSWASFTLLSDAEAFATTTRTAHPTWIVTVHDMENERYQRQIARERQQPDTDSLENRGLSLGSYAN